MRLIKILEKVEKFEQESAPYLLCPCCSKFFKHNNMKAHLKTLRHRDNTNEIMREILRMENNIVDKPEHYQKDKKFIEEFN